MRISISKGCASSPLFILFFVLCSSRQGRAQNIPSPEAFVNAILDSATGSDTSHIYLVAGVDSCWFTKFNYDEWENYTLRESVPLTTLNELSEKVSLARFPYFWKTALLPRAILLTRHQSDSLINTGPHRQPLPKQKILYSLSLPEFTDDGQYAVIDINLICGVQCGQGFTCIFHKTPDGWKLIGKHNNWAS